MDWKTFEIMKSLHIQCSTSIRNIFEFYSYWLGWFWTNRINGSNIIMKQIGMNAIKKYFEYWIKLSIDYTDYEIICIKVKYVMKSILAIINWCNEWKRSRKKIENMSTQNNTKIMILYIAQCTHKHVKNILLF